jgi:predicted nucleic acid-binding protein
MIVLDTSAAIQWLLKGPEAHLVHPVLQDAEWICAPDLFVAELANVLWKYHRFQNLALPNCEQSLTEGMRLVNELVPMKELSAEAFSMACLASKPTYDMFYLVLARRRNSPLLTMDKSLRETAQKYGVKVI